MYNKANPITNGTNDKATKAPREEPPPTSLGGRGERKTVNCYQVPYRVSRDPEEVPLTKRGLRAERGFRRGVHVDSDKNFAWHVLAGGCGPTIGGW